MEGVRNRRKFSLLFIRISQAIIVPQQILLIGTKDWQSTGVERSTAKQPDEKKVEQAPRNTLKYYFNRFRYYHYCLVEKVDTIIGVVCLTIIKIYFYLMGFEQSNLQIDGNKNTMSIDDVEFE